MKADVKVVVRYADGRVLKGTTLNFDPNRQTFALKPVDGAGEATVVQMAELKAVFFVRTFDGNPTYTERSEFVRPQAGRRMAVRFSDGESLVGVSLTYSAARDGFFLFPADPVSNNERVYVLQKSVSAVDWL